MSDSIVETPLSDKDDYLKKDMKRFPNKIICKDNVLYCQVKGIYMEIGEAVNVLSTNRNIDTDEYFLFIEFYYKGKSKKIEAPRQVWLKKNEIVKLQSKGFDVTERTADAYISYIQTEEKNAPEKLVHSSVGYSNYNGKDIFKHHIGININSSYNGRLDIEPKGTYEVWHKLVVDYVLGNTALEAMLVIGFSSAIVGITGAEIGQDSIFIHASGDSTQGKTIAGMTAVSIWGNPSLKIRDGLASTWNSTENAIFSNIVQNYGLVVLLDEISMSDSQDFTQAVYRLSSGRDKLRLDKDSSQKELGTWSTVIISTGEFRLLEKAKKNTGAKMRVIDLADVTFTKDAESAEGLKEGILQNHGHAGVKFVEKLLSDMDANSICTEVKEIKEEVILKMKKEFGLDDKFVPRRAWKYAILMYTAQKVKELLNLEINIEGIFQFFMEHEKESLDNRNMKENALDYLLEQVTMNYKKFINSKGVAPVKEDDVNNRAIDIWGKINVLQNKSYNEICIIKEAFINLMKDGGFEDPMMILKAWKDKGILDVEKDRLTRKRKLIDSASLVNVYVIKVEKEKRELEAS